MKRNFFSEQNTTEQNIIRFQCLNYGCKIDILLEEYPILEDEAYARFYDRFKVQTLGELLPSLDKEILTGRQAVLFLKEMLEELQLTVSSQDVLAPCPPNTPV